MKNNIKCIKRLEKNIDKYRPITFWSWNAELQESMLRKQIREMKKAGMGGFFVHARSGLKTEYMGEEWYSAVEVSMDEAHKQKLQVWCYDENGWPSGFAGMKLLENKDNFAHYITMEKKTFYDDTALAVYTIEDNCLVRMRGTDSGATCYYTIYDHTNSSVVDILNEQIVKHFIDLTHEKYYERYGNEFGNRFVGFFTDEPQYFRYDTPYSPILGNLYEELYHEDLLDSLAALFLDCYDCYKFRYRYWKMLGDQFIRSFVKQVYGWCDSHNCKLTGHAIEEQSLHTQMWCCAGVMPFYEYEHIPGCDWLGCNIYTELTPKQVGSVAQQLGKKQVITESFACTGWDVNPRELKRIVEWQYVNGVNMLCTHLTPYSLEGNRKFDHPAFFSKVNPWFEQFKCFSTYVAKLGCILAESNEYAPVGVIHAMHSAYLTYNRNRDYYSIEELERNFQTLVEKMGRDNIPHHYIDETLLARHGEVCGSKLRVGWCKYESIVIPQMQNLDETTVVLLREYLKNGGKLWLAGEAPEYVNGEPQNLSFLKSNMTYEELKPELYRVNTKSDSVRSTYRKTENEDFLYLVNISIEQTADIEIDIKAEGILRLYLEDSKCERLKYKRNGNHIMVPLCLQPSESAILILCEELPETKRKIQEVQVTFSKPLMKYCDDNSLPLDYVQISYDNQVYMERLPVQYAAEYLLAKCENREVFLKYTFDICEIPDSLILEAEKMNISAMVLNGTVINLTNPGILDAHFISGDILPFVKEGENVLVIQINYYQKEHVYDVLFRTPDLTESLINCLTYDTEISNVYLRGKFGVYNLNPMHKTEDSIYVLDSHICIGGAGTPLMDDITGNGYPFFAGKVMFELEAEVEGQGDIYLYLEGRFESARLKWNEYEVDVVLSDHIIIPSKQIKEHNKIMVTLFSSNRNLLGPHHWAKELEPKTVMPFHFTINKGWKDGKNDDYRDSYSLIPFGIKLKTKNKNA